MAENFAQHKFWLSILTGASRTSRANGTPRTKRWKGTFLSLYVQHRSGSLFVSLWIQTFRLILDPNKCVLSWSLKCEKCASHFIIKILLPKFFGLHLKGEQGDDGKQEGPPGPPGDTVSWPQIYFILSVVQIILMFWREITKDFS